MAMSAELRGALAELERRRSAPSIEAGSFPAQLAFADDPCRLKLALCTRRAGKTGGNILQMLRIGRQHFGSTMYVLTKTTATSLRIYCHEDDGGLPDFNRRCNLGLSFVRGADPCVRFPNGSVIWMMGLDATDEQRKKLRGQKPRLVIVDEAQDIHANLEQLIRADVGPSLVDHQGTLVLSGTPSDYTASYFYELTKGDKAPAGWSLHRWSAHENPHVAAEWAKEIAALKADHPGIEGTPWFRQMYLGEWAIDDSALVYRPGPSAFDVSAPPPGQRYVFILAIDLGLIDASAFVVGAYSYTDERLYVVEAYKRSDMDLTDVEERIRYYQARYDLTRIVIDDAAKQGVEELRRRRGLPLVSAEKRGKAEFIAMMNSDFDHGRIKVLPEAAEGLRAEWSALVWDAEQKAKRKMVEAPGCENHLSDAALYLWREARNYMASKPAATPSPEQELDEWHASREVPSPYDALEREFGLDSPL